MARINKKVTKSKSKSKSKKNATKTEPGRIVLASRSCIRSIAELRNQMALAENIDSEIVIDASKVESVDTAVLQLMVAFVNSVRRQSRAIRWNEPSSEFREMATLAGLSECLEFGDHTIVEEDDGLCPVF